ncbi:hypothetical protein EJ03DRAFT_331884 [Teratosphaeria nubilosa]|uniref:Uncharacterized protein n=1 Tax=Teratosphaeria nubilosa TaxID=161662 RepID=A0A6G1KWG7_9PEZI|nr:hypothetical protein EJ03DRAFT_331884 [Teratosphaeria nubilosa]
MASLGHSAEAEQTLQALSNRVGSQQQKASPRPSPATLPPAIPAPVTPARVAPARVAPAVKTMSLDDVSKLSASIAGLDLQVNNTALTYRSNIPTSASITALTLALSTQNEEAQTEALVLISDLLDADVHDASFSEKIKAAQESGGLRIPLFVRRMVEAGFEKERLMGLLMGWCL